MIDYQKKFRLDGKIAFVIGGMGLIGREISMAFASSGAKTFVFDQEKKQALEFEKKISEKIIHCGSVIKFLIGNIVKNNK